MPHIPVYGKRKLLKLNMVSVCTRHEIRLGNDKLCMSVKKRVAGLRGCLNKRNRLLSMFTFLIALNGFYAHLVPLQGT